MAVHQIQSRLRFGAILGHAELQRINIARSHVFVTPRTVRQHARAEAVLLRIPPIGIEALAQGIGLVTVFPGDPLGKTARATLS